MYDEGKLLLLKDMCIHKYYVLFMTTYQIVVHNAVIIAGMSLPLLLSLPTLRLSHPVRYFLHFFFWKVKVKMIETKPTVQCEVSALSTVSFQTPIALAAEL